METKNKKIICTNLNKIVSLELEYDTVYVQQEMSPLEIPVDFICSDNKICGVEDSVCSLRQKFRESKL